MPPDEFTRTGAVAVGGYNPLRWDCEDSGCFNEDRRPKIEVFADCFPGRTNFGDVDGQVELAGFFCQIEWKGPGGSLHTGQRITFEQLTRQNGNIVFVIEGDAKTMAVTRFCRFWRGRCGPWVNGDLQILKRHIARWAKWAAFAKGF